VIAPDEPPPFDDERSVPRRRRPRRWAIPALVAGLVVALGGAGTAVVLSGWGTKAPGAAPARDEAAQTPGQNPGTAAPQPNVSGRGGIGGAAPKASNRPAGPLASACAPWPSFPDASCTGWQHTGVKLKPQSGDIEVTEAGTVIDGIDLQGSITIKASNVTVKRSRIHGAYGVGTRDHTPYTNILIEDVELDGYVPAMNTDQLGLSGIDGDGITVRRANIHGFGSLIRTGYNFTVEDSWLHDNRGGTDLTGQPTHNTALSAHYGRNLTIRHNRLSCNAGNHCSSAVSIYAKDAVPEGISHVDIEQNIFRTDDGPCLFAGHDTNGGPNALASYMTVTQNAFMPNDCGAGYVFHWGTTDDAGNSLHNVWSGNYLYPNQAKAVEGAF